MGSSTHFPAEDKLHEKSDYHGWKMSLDLRLEEQEVLDHVRGGIVEPLLGTNGPREKSKQGRSSGILLTSAWWPMFPS